MKQSPLFLEASFGGRWDGGCESLRGVLRFTTLNKTETRAKLEMNLFLANLWTAWAVYLQDKVYLKHTFSWIVKPSEHTICQDKDARVHSVEQLVPDCGRTMPGGLLVGLSAIHVVLVPSGLCILNLVFWSEWIVIVFSRPPPCSGNKENDTCMRSHGRSREDTNN